MSARSGIWIEPFAATMSQRFIRCPHCRLPHEATLAMCPTTGAALETRKAKAEPTSDASYTWAHTLAPGAAEGEAMTPTSLDAHIGRVVDGKYRIDALIGRGGMGAVFRAVNLRIGKPVALKVLYGGSGEAGVAEARFLREARLVGSLGHPHIVELFDLGHLEGKTPYQVMELLDGESLAARIHGDGPLAEGEAIRVGTQVLSGLEAAHARGVVHRDLKPENVFLTEHDGRTFAKLLDFGVSKRIDDHSLNLTQTGVVVGTPYYLSPEQARGERHVDHRIDLWAMGVLLYEMITGVVPFTAPNYEALIAKIRDPQPAPPSRFAASITPRFEAVILRSLAVSPEDRPASARAMRIELEEARAQRSAPRRRPQEDDVTEVSDRFEVELEREPEP